MSRIPVRTPSRGSNGREKVDLESASVKELNGRLKAANLGTRTTTISSTVSQPLKVKENEGFRTPARPQRKVEPSTAVKTGFTGTRAPQTLRKPVNTAKPPQSPGTSKVQASHSKSGSIARDVPKTPSLDKSKTSTGLREHIARARAELQKSAKKPPAPARDTQRPVLAKTESSSIMVDLSEDPFAFESDPFNQKKFKPVSHPVVDRGIERARQDGRLNISNCELTDVPRSVYDMYKPNPSQVIDFSNTDEPAWYEFVDLSYFNAADNEISEIGDDFVDVFGGVSTIDLHNNRLKSLPDTFLQLSQLQCINLAGNGLDTAAFRLICRIETIVELNFSRNALDGILDSATSDLKNLTVLDVSGNSLSGIGMSLSGCSKLQKLNLNGNRIDQITTTELSVLTSLVELDLSRNHISIPIINSSMNFPRLEILNLAHNVLHQLQNRLDSLDGIVCPNLINLNIEGNHHTTFPDMIYGLADLRHLDISDNRITELDYKIGSLPLTHFRWEGNPVRLRGCFGMDTISMLAYLRNRAPQPPIS